MRGVSRSEFDDRGWGAPDDDFYDRDFYGWTQEQAAAIRKAGEDRANTGGIYWENVAKEVESLGRGELRAMESALVRITEHLLKLRYSPEADSRDGWQVSVDLQRDDLRRLKRDSPCLVRKIDLDGVYVSTRRVAGKSLPEHDGLPGSALPERNPFTLEEIECDDWYPDPLN